MHQNEKWWRWRESNPRLEHIQSYTSTSLVNFFIVMILTSNFLFQLFTPAMQWTQFVAQVNFYLFCREMTSRLLYLRPEGKGSRCLGC